MIFRAVSASACITLSRTSGTASLQASSKNPKRGTVFTTNEVFNQDGLLVLTMKARGFFARRSRSD